MNNIQSIAAPLQSRSTRSQTTSLLWLDFGMHKFTLERKCGHSAWAYPTHGVCYTGKFEFEQTRLGCSAINSFERKGKWSIWFILIIFFADRSDCCRLSSRSLAYSSDMWWRMVYQKCQMGLSYPKLAKGGMKWHRSQLQSAWIKQRFFSDNLLFGKTSSI